MNLEIFHRQKIIYFISFFLYNFARVLPHAVLTVILLNKGMTVGNIAIIQSFFMLAGILFEFPSGVLTDLWLEKYVYIISLFLLFISYYIILLSSDFYLLCLSWFIYGISNATMNSSLEMYFLRTYQNDSYKIKKFNIQFNNVNLYSTLVGGGIGSFIYEFSGNGIYYISIVFIIISALMIILFFGKTTKGKQSESSISSIMKDIKIIYQNQQLLLNIILMAIFQIIIQIFFQFWQVIFLNINFDKKYFGIFYILFQLVAIGANYIFKKFNWNKSYYLLILLISITFILINLLSNQSMFMFVLILFLLPFNIYSNQVIVDIQKLVPGKIMSSLMSFVGTLCSISSIIILWGIGVFDKVFSFKQIVVILILLFMIFSIVIVRIITNKKID
ncbi:MFS transporter [Lactobacillus sp. S2-2]|uniref:MFS transporter n=1 Tax=Lactobacillus sp. S2-2 TaxID=2692917 RepID=UPI001F2D0CBB|nr:MFS transporter [Lactobacillus sp. S2-2]MCF6515337.1 MFS transporter [Lactobacillus sp. S2-2]